MAAALKDATDRIARAERHCDRVKRGQRASCTRGRCRQCRRRVQAGSRCRCPVCLEIDRRAARRRRGIRSVRPRSRGQRMLGAWAERRRAFDRDETLRQRQQEAAGPQVRRTAADLTDEDRQFLFGVLWELQVARRHR